MEFKRGKTINEVSKQIGLGEPQSGDIVKCLTTIDLHKGKWHPASQSMSPGFFSCKLYKITKTNYSFPGSVESGLILMGENSKYSGLWISYEQFKLYFKRT